MATLYATISDLKQTLDGTDAGSGTAAQLTDAQLTLALTAASNRVSVYSGNIWDGSLQPVPDIVKDLTLDLAAWWAFTFYLKSKALPATHPVAVRYAEAKAVLEDARAGKIRLDPAPGGQVIQEGGLVINRIPNIFTYQDSNTRLNPVTGYLEAATPPDMWRPDWDLSTSWDDYQG